MRQTSAAVLLVVIGASLRLEL